MSVVQGKVVNHGSAPYKNTPDNNQSYFVELEGDNGEVRELWGMGIRDAIQLQGIQKGEDVAFYDQGLAEGSKKRNWDVERVEKLKNYKNSIEEGVAPSAKKNTSLDKAQDKPLNSKYKAEEEEELDLPTSVKNQYIYKIKNRALAGEKINFYERDGDAELVAFEDRSKSLHTSREDSKTIKAMLDVAQAKNWSSVNLKGTEAFKREAWLEASIRGIEVKGFKPQEKDFIELQKRQAERNTNQVSGNETRSRELSSKSAEKQIEQEALIRSNEFDAGRDIDYSSGSEVEAEVENFHNNLAVPTGTKGISKAEATRKIEASFDKKINNAQRNEVKENIEDRLKTKDKIAVEAMRRAIDERFKSDPSKLQEKHDALNEKIPDIVAGKLSIEPPTINKQPEVEVITRDMGSLDRSR